MSDDIGWSIQSLRREDGDPIKKYVAAIACVKSTFLSSLSLNRSTSREKQRPCKTSSRLESRYEGLEKQRLSQQGLGKGMIIA